MTSSWTATIWHSDIVPADHETDGLLDILGQYESTPRLKSALSALLTQVQSLEDLAYAVLVGRSVYTAIGDQLDVLGKLVGQPRGELVDDAYRVFVLGRIAANRSDAKLPTLIDILELLEVPAPILIARGPCEITICISGSDYGDIVGDLIGDAKAGGVRLHWFWSDEDYADALTWGPIGVGQTVSATHGFGEIGGAPATGGHLSWEFAR